MRKVLTAILISFTLETPKLMGMEIQGEHPDVSPYSSTQLVVAENTQALIQEKIGHDDLIRQVFLFLPLLDVLHMKETSRWWKGVGSKATDHLNHRILTQDLSAHFKTSRRTFLLSPWSVCVCLLRILPFDRDGSGCEL